jgi:FHA domain-containing protein
MTMILTLVAVSLNDQPLSQPITAVFDARGGTIGRADHNTMALPDPQRHVSRLQAEVVAQDQGFLIRNVGSANPIVIGTRSLANGETQYLVQGDTLRVGPYLLKVQVANAESESPTRPSLQRLTPPAPARAFEPTPPTAPAPLPGQRLRRSARWRRCGRVERQPVCRSAGFPRGCATRGALAQRQRPRSIRSPI